MAIKVAITLLVAATASVTVLAQDVRQTYTASEYLKNYALSTCIADGYLSGEVKADSAAAARGYLEFGELPLEAYTEATLLGRKFLEKNYKSVSGKTLTLMKCIDLFHSQELEHLAEKYRRPAP
jgi:hypothetical protein